MASIDNLKSILHYTVSDGRKKLPCLITPSQNETGNMIGLYYNGENEVIAIGNASQIGKYNQGVQIAVRHSDYQKARTVAYNALELLGISRDSKSGVFYNLNETEAPSFVGVDDTGANVWAFNIRMIGDK